MAAPTGQSRRPRPRESKHCRSDLRSRSAAAAARLLSGRAQWPLPQNRHADHARENQNIVGATPRSRQRFVGAGRGVLLRRVCLTSAQSETSGSLTAAAALRALGRAPTGCLFDVDAVRRVFSVGATPRSRPDQLLCAVTSTYMVSFCPGRRILLVSILFQRASCAIDTRKRLAMRYSESPFRTV